MDQEITYIFKKPRWLKLSIIILAVIVLLAGTVGYAAYKNNNNSDEGYILGDTAGPLVQTQKVLTKTVSNTISLSAVTQPLDEIKVSPKMSGKVVALYVNEGDFVYTGQAVVQLEQDQTILANYNTANNNYQIAQKNLENTILSTQKDVEAAEIGVSTAEKSLDSARKNLTNTSDKIIIDISSTYENAKLKSNSTLLTANNALAAIKKILDDHAQRCYCDFCQSFMTANSQSFNDLMVSYPSARLEYNKTLDYYNSIKDNATHAEIEKLLVKIANVLNKTSSALDDMRVVLDYAITNVNFTATQLEIAKNSIYNNQALIDGALTGIEATEQSIANLKIGNTISSDAVQTAIDLAEKQLEAAKKTLSSVKAKAEIQINSAKIQVESARGQLDVISAQLDNTTITSPISGVINQKFINVGEMAMVGAPLFTVVNTNSIKVEVGLTEFDIGKVSVGQEVKISLSANPDEEFLGHIYYVSKVADDSKKFPVKIQIENKDGRIKAGMVAKIDIITFQEDNALIIPKESIFYQNGEQRIYAVEDSTVKIKTIKTEPVNEKELKVIEGLTEGEEIIIQGNFNLQEGQRVIIQNEAI